MSANQTIEVEETDSNWLTTDAAARRMNMSRRQFEIRWRNGDIIAPRYRVEGERQFYYDPNDLRSNQLDDLTEDSEIRDMPTAALLAQAYSHNEILLKQVTELTMQLLAHQSEENEKLRGRCNQLEDSHTALIQAREEMLNDHHARELATKQAEADTERKDKALSGLMKLAPQVLQAHTAGKLNTGAVKFLDSISAEQIQMLLQLNEFSEDGDKMLTPDQVTMLEKLLAHKQAQAPASKPEPETEDTPNESSN